MNIQNTSKKTYKPLLILSMFVVLVISTTTAFFTSSSESDDNIFKSGDLEIDVIQDNVFNVQEWSPGSEHTLEFSMLNNGTLNEYVKGYLGGSWDNESLDPTVIKISKLERRVNNEWLVIESGAREIGDEFYLSDDGTMYSLIELGSGSKEDFRITVKLVETIGDEYQNEIFVANLHLAARQSIEGADWPSIY